MYKIILVASFFLSGCANYPITGTMCDRKDPMDPLPSNCRAYNDEAATKASTTKKEILNADEAIEFTKE